jgi:RNA polymerase sigma-70 factor (ECF subfamily)
MLGHSVASPAAAHSDEHAWIIRAQGGDRQAFDELVRRHRAGVVNVVYRMCGEAELAEEAAQEAFLRAWQSLGRFNPTQSAIPGAAFRNWVYRIAMNLAVDMLRRERPTTSLVDPEAWPSAEETPEALVERRQRAEQVQRAVLDLPAASRSVLVLREYEALSYQDIADTLNIPLGTVMSRLNYARQQLRRVLGAPAEAA